MSPTRSYIRPIELLPLFQEKVWGRLTLAPFYPQLPSKGHIGEVWFSVKENPTAAGQTLGELIHHHPEILGEALRPAQADVCPLLVKLLFTTERLSVQVHPNDDYARQHHQSLGKTEAWYVVSAEPEGEVAVGFKEHLSPQRLAEAARSGEIEDLLDWQRVQAGDTIFVPAGTVHAIGAGVTICEVQENSDITYRLYDYGRPRELHLDHGVNVSELGPHHYHVSPCQLSPGREELVVCEYFRMERLTRDVRFPGGAPYYSILTCTKGNGQIAGEPFTPGQSWFVPAHSEAFEIRGTGAEWILSYTALEPATLET